jgi:uncharacterized OB-fold protein
VAIQRADFPLPDTEDPLTAPFFAGAARGELVVTRCDDCGRYVWYPAETCTECGSRAIVWTAVSGRGALFSWAVVARAFLPAFTEQVPFVTALVALEEDPYVRIATYVVDADPDTLRPDMPVIADFRPLTFPTVPDRAVVVPMFRPVP